MIERPDSQIPPLFDLTAKRRDEIIEGLVQRIVKAGMGSPALIFLESQRPLGRMAGNVLHVFSPFIGVFLPSVDQYGHLLQDPVNLEIIVDRIQELEEERGRQQRALRAERKARAKERKMKAGGYSPPPEPTASARGDPEGEEGKPDGAGEPGKEPPEGTP